MEFMSMHKNINKKDKKNKEKLSIKSVLNSQKYKSFIINCFNL